MSEPERLNYARDEIFLPHPLDIDDYHGYPSRLWVPPHQRPWDVELPGYAPPVLLYPEIENAPYPQADPPWERLRDHPFARNYVQMGLLLGEHGPQNPAFGRTGLTGRAGWKHFGPNFTTGGAIIRIYKDVPYALMVVRGDSGRPALPGGKVRRSDYPLGELDHYSRLFDLGIRTLASEAAFRRECCEEAGYQVRNMELLRLVHAGPTAGPRTTDVAWADEMVWADIDVASSLPELHADDNDILGRLWMPITQRLFLPGRQGIMHSAHGLFLQVVTSKLELEVPPDWDERQLDETAQRLSQAGDDVAERFLGLAA